MTYLLQVRLSSSTAVLTSEEMKKSVKIPLFSYSLSADSHPLWKYASAVLDSNSLPDGS